MLSNIRSLLLITMFFASAAFGHAQSAPADASHGTNAAPASASSATVTENDQTLRSYLRLQEQLHAALLAVEQARLEASLEARTNAELLAAGLSRLERSLAEERQQRNALEHDSNRALLVLGAVVLGIGLAALALMAYLQSRGISRLAEMALRSSAEPMAGFPALKPVPSLPPTQLRDREGMTVTSDRLLATIGRLETRIHELEHSAQRALGAGPMEPGASGDSDTAGAKAKAPGGEETAGLLGKAQALLQLGLPEKALACFDEVLERTPDKPEALLGKGLALERLQRLDEALACYDRAIEGGQSHAQASLRKAEILSRQERFAEALECYEQVLRAGAKA